MEPTTAPTHPPKDDPFTKEQLAQFDGTDPEKPVYVAIKGQIFDVSPKREMYAPGKGYHIFAGKDGSRGLGMSSLKVEDAVSDWSTLTDKEKGVLNDWVRISARAAFVVHLTDQRIHSSIDTRTGRLLHEAIQHCRKARRVKGDDGVVEEGVGLALPLCGRGEPFFDMFFTSHPCFCRPVLATVSDSHFRPRDSLFNFRVPPLRFEPFQSTSCQSGD